MSKTQPAEPPDDAAVPDGFMSYAHDDSEVVLPITEAARARGRRLWIDGDGIPPGAPWRTELGTAIEAASAVVTCLSPDWLESVECRREFDRAVELGKRLVPVLVAPVPHEVAPDRLAALQWIDASDHGEPGALAEKILSAIDTDHDRVREHTQWLARALHWDSRGRDRSSLLRGRDLQAAEDWISRAGVDPSPAPLQVDLVTASRNAERRRLRSIIAIAMFTVLVTTASAVFALVQRNEAINQRNLAQSRALAAAAQSQLDIDPERSLLLASAAYASAPTSQAVAALRTALQQSRVRVTVAAHQASVSGIVWSSDGRTVLTSARDGSLAAWDAASGQSRGRLELGSGAIERLVAARTAPIGVAMTEGGAAVLWRIEPGNGQLTRLAELADSDISDVAISDDGRVVVAAMGLEGVGVWTGDGRPAPAVPWARVDARSVALSGDGATLLIGGSDRTIAGPVGAGRPIVLEAGPSPTLQLSADGSIALLAPDERPASLRRVDTGQLVQALPLAFHAALDPDGRRAVVAQVDGQVDLLSVDAPLVQLLPRGAPATALGFAADGSQVVTGQLDGNIQLWRSDDGTSIAQLRGPTASAARLAFAPDDRRLVSGRGDGTVQVWELPTQPLRLPLSEGANYPFEATGVDFAPDGTTVLTAAGSGQARMWDPATGLEKPAGDRCRDLPTGDGCLARATVLAQLGKLTAADYSPDGLLIATSSEFGSVLVWDSTTAERVSRAPDVRGPVDDLAFGPDSRQLATADRAGTVRIVEARTGAVRSVFGPVDGAGGVYAVAFRPGGDAVLAAGEDGTVREWDTAATPPVPRDLANLGDAVFDLAVDRDGRNVAAATTTGIVLLDAADGHRVRTFVGHRGFATRVAFSPDGALLFSGGLDGTVRGWDVGTGDMIAVFTLPGGDVQGLDVDRDGHRVAAAAASGDAYVYDCEICSGPDELARLAAQRVTRSLTAEERATFAAP